MKASDHPWIKNMTAMPCGLAATGLFNDEFQLERLDSANNVAQSYNVNTDNITWYEDTLKGFVNLDNT